MSFDIVYDRQFILVKDRYIPVICTGNSNCWQVNYQGRDIIDKNWINLSYQDTYVFTKGQLAAYANQYINAMDIYKTHYTPFEEGEFTRFLINGMKYAQPIEFFVDRKIPFKLKIGQGSKPTEFTVTTTNELLKVINMAEAQNEILHFYFTCRGATWPKQKSELPTPTKNEVGYYVLCHKNYYVKDITPTSCLGTYELTSAIRFESKEALENYQINNKEAFMKWKIVVRLVKPPKLTSNNTVYVLKFGDNYLYENTNTNNVGFYRLQIGTKYFNTADEAREVALNFPNHTLEVLPMPKQKVVPAPGFYTLRSMAHGEYLYRQTKTRYKHCYSARDAKKFRTEKEAQRYIDQYPEVGRKYKIAYIDTPWIFS